MNNEKTYRIETGVKLTPTLATQWLETVKRQRNIRESKVEEYCELMRSGKWVPRNGDTMRFDWNGEFRDGQHRAWAVVYSGVPIIVDVAHNLDPESIRTIDCGSARSYGDTIVMEGKELGTNIKHARTIGSALKIVEAYFAGNIYDSQRNVSNNRIWELYNKYESISHVAEYISSKKLLISNTNAVALLFIFSHNKATKEKAYEFFDKFASGVNLGARNPIMVLRNKFIKFKTEQKGSMSKHFVFSCMIKAWEAYRTGKQIQRIMFDPENLPHLKRRKIVGKV